MSVQRLVAFLGLLMLLLAYLALAVVAFWTMEGQEALIGGVANALLLTMGFGLALTFAFTHTLRIFRQYLESLYELSQEDADGLVSRLIFGMQPIPATNPVLRVKAGQLALDGPPVAYRVGGPAKLSVDHNSAVVTSRLGTLSRVLGPGFHNLQPYERVWDIVDLRPQRRSVTVDFMTRDGIPATCQARIVCRIAGLPDITATAEGVSVSPFGYAEEAVLKVTTEKFVRKLEGDDRVSDWITGMAEGALDGAVRDVLEQYPLDAFLDPRGTNAGDEGKTTSTLRRIPELEREVEEKVRADGEKRGGVVKSVELGMIRPTESAIPREWLEFWQARLQREVDRRSIAQETTQTERAEEAYAEAQARFIGRVLEEVQRLQAKGVVIPPQLILSGFLKVLQSMPDQEPNTRYMQLRQVHELLNSLGSLPHQDDSPAQLPRDLGFMLPPETE